MVLVILLDFSTMLLPDFRKVQNAYWANFVSLFQLLCYIVLVTKDGPRKLSFKCYKEMYIKCVNEKSDDIVFNEEIHGWVHKNFRDMVDTYNSDGSTEEGATPVYSTNIPDLTAFKCPKTCTLEHYLNKRDIKENCDWVKSSSLMTNIPAPLAAGIIRAGVQYTKNQK